MLTARLIIDCDELAEIDRLRPGDYIDVEVTDLHAGLDGELIDTDLRPQSVVALSMFAAVEPPSERDGPLVRVFLTSPKEDRHGEG